MPIRIQRQRTKGWRMPAGAICVSRPNRYSNPFPVNNDGVATHCICLKLDGNDLADRHIASVDLFKTWVERRKINELIACMLPNVGPPPLIRHIQRDLRGRDLVCWCGPRFACHVDYLLEIANAK